MKRKSIILSALLLTGPASAGFFTAPVPPVVVCRVVIEYAPAVPTLAAIQAREPIVNPIARHASSDTPCTEAGDRVAIGAVVMQLIGAGR